MERPGLVADCVAAMRAAAPVEVTVKCRIGVDDQEPARGAARVSGHASARRACDRFTIHARKAWLQGLSPKENRDDPAARLRSGAADEGARFRICTCRSTAASTASIRRRRFLDAGLDGVMIGRAAYHDPARSCRRPMRASSGRIPRQTAGQAVQAMLPYIEAHLAAGGRLHQITRHMLGLFTGRPGARAWRRVLSRRRAAAGRGAGAGRRGAGRGQPGRRGRLSPAGGAAVSIDAGAGAPRQEDDHARHRR